MGDARSIDTEQLSLSSFHSFGTEDAECSEPRCISHDNSSRTRRSRMDKTDLHALTSWHLRTRACFDRLGGSQIWYFPRLAGSIDICRGTRMPKHRLRRRQRNNTLDARSDKQTKERKGLIMHRVAWWWWWRRWSEDKTNESNRLTSAAAFSLASSFAFASPSCSVAASSSASICWIRFCKVLLSSSD